MWLWNYNITSLVHLYVHPVLRDIIEVSSKVCSIIGFAEVIANPIMEIKLSEVKQ